MAAPLAQYYFFVFMKVSRYPHAYLIDHVPYCPFVYPFGHRIFLTSTRPYYRSGENTSLISGEHLFRTLRNKIRSKTGLNVKKVPNYIIRLIAANVGFVIWRSGDVPRPAYYITLPESAVVSSDDASERTTTNILPCA